MAMRIDNVLTLSQYLHNKSKRAKAIYVSGEVKKTIIDGKQYSEAELDNEFPIHLPLFMGRDLRKYKGDNKDKTKIGR